MEPGRGRAHLPPLGLPAGGRQLHHPAPRPPGPPPASGAYDESSAGGASDESSAGGASDESSAGGASGVGSDASGGAGASNAWLVEAVVVGVELGGWNCRFTTSPLAGSRPPGTPAG